MFRKGQDGYPRNMTDRKLVEHKMDEVDAMTLAGESVGKAVGTGLRAARRGAVRAGHVGASAAVQIATKAEHKLAEHGMAADQIRDALGERADALVGKAEEVEKSTRRARKRLAKQRKRLAKKSGSARDDLLGKADEVRKEISKVAGNVRKETKVSGKDVRKAAKQVRKEFAAQTPGRHRRWPWVLGLLIAGAAAGYVVLTRRPEEVHLHEEAAIPPAVPVTPDDEASESTEAQHALNGQITDHHR